MRRKIKNFATDFMGHDAGTHSSSIAFFFFMSLIPLLILLTALVPFFGIDAAAVSSLFREILPTNAGGFIDGVIKEAFDNSGIAFSLAAVMLLWSASRGVTALIKGLNAVCDEKDSRRPALITALSIGYTLALMAFMILVMLLIFSGRVLRLLKNYFPNIRLQTATATYIEFLLLLLVGILLFSFVYTFLPAGRRKFMEQFPGAVLTSSGLVIFSLGLYVYVNMFNSFTRIYGSLGAVILLLFWMYWTFFILLLGGYVNSHLTEILPVRFVTYLRENKRMGIIICFLFLLGFLAYLSNCYLSWKVLGADSSKEVQLLLKLGTIISWLSATWICARKMRGSFPMRYTYPLAVFVFVDLVVMRRELIRNRLLFLLAFTLWNILFLLVCIQTIFGNAQPDKKVSA